MTRTIVGLEITEEGVRAAEVTTGRTPTLLASGSVPLPPGTAKDSEVFDRDALAIALRQEGQQVLVNVAPEGEHDEARTILRNTC